jgi:hypothetical protein
MPELRRNDRDGIDVLLIDRTPTPSAPRAHSRTPASTRRSRSRAGEITRHG